MFRRLILLPVLAAFWVPSASRAAFAQDADPAVADPPAHVAFVDGSATLEREGRADAAPLNMPLLSGDRVRTTDGRVEILFGDSSSLYLDAQTTIDFQSDNLLRLIDGRVRLNIPGPSQAIDYRIDSPAGSVRIEQPGEYRISMLRGDRDTQVELAVLRGEGEVFTEQGSMTVRAGERAYASAGLAPSYPYSFNSAAWDEFDRWAEMRRDARLGVSAQYLPSEMRTYAPVFDAYGDWRYYQPYGYVWYPRVAVGWRPYYYGRWMAYPRYGWTWIGIDRFGWPTHHYGRWGFSSGAWFWIPGRYWSPAWVSWAYAPGYVSWCPLGFDNRPVFALSVGIGVGRYYSPWNAWTVVAAPHFGFGFVNQRVIRVDRVFDVRSRPVFQSRPDAPAFRDVAVPRNSAPIRWAGTRTAPSDRTGPAITDRGGSRDSYFSRSDVRRDRAVPRDGGATLPVPNRSTAERGSESNPNAPRAAPRGSDSNPNAPRAAPRGSEPNANAPRATPRERAPETAPPSRDTGSRPRPRSGGSPATNGQAAYRDSGAVRRTAPEGVVRRVEPRGYTPREQVVGSGRSTPYARTPAPVMRESQGVERIPSPIIREPRAVERSTAPMRAPMYPSRPAGEYAPRPSMGSPRPEMAVPRQAPMMRESAPAHTYEPRARPSGPEPSAGPRSAAPERSAPSGGAGGSRGHAVPRGGRGR